MNEQSSLFSFYFPSLLFALSNIESLSMTFFFTILGWEVNYNGIFVMSFSRVDRRKSIKSENSKFRKRSRILLGVYSHWALFIHTEIDMSNFGSELVTVGLGFF